jgi:hypothetical protein
MMMHYRKVHRIKNNDLIALLLSFHNLRRYLRQPYNNDYASIIMNILETYELDNKLWKTYLENMEAEV